MSWIEENNTLRRDFIFKDFKEAFAAMTQIALIAEKMDHHPDWSNCYNRLTIRLSTHDAGHEVTDKDRELARQIDHLDLM